MSKVAILNDHKQHFIKRLITRNPLLKCTASAYREDITELVKISLEIDKAPKKTSELEVLESLLADKPKKVEIFNTHKKNLAKFTKIKNEAEDYFHTTGQLSFYLGYPFVAIPLESNRYYLAPLFLWAVSCKVTATSIVFDRIRDEENQVLEPELNRILQVWLAHEKNIYLKWDNAENLIWNNVAEETKTALSAWVKCDSSLDNTLINPIPNKDSFQNLIKAKVISSAIIGYIPIKGQALLNDLDNLEELFKSNSDTHVLDYFLNPRQLKSEQPASNPIENNKWIVTDSDHSQESVLWNTRKFDLMVLQGPPGTGKSQVIVNLIADALANQKKILVVCQKKAALEVLRKRLTANGLGELLELIDDVQKDRMRIIKALREMENGSLTKKSFSHIDIERKTTSDILKSCEIFLDNANYFLTDNLEGQRLNYGNLKAKLYELNERGFNVFEKFQPLYQHCIKNNLLPNNKQELEELMSQAKIFIENYRTCDYPRNPWINLENTAVNNSEINNLINKLVILASSLECKNDYFYTESLAWIAENNLLSNYYPSFLPPDSKDIQNNFKELVINTKKLKTWLSANYIDSILAAVRTGEVIKHYQDLKQTIGYLELIIYIKHSLENSQIFNILPKKSTNQVLSWIDIIECFSFQSWFDNLTAHYNVSKFEFENQKNKLIKVTEQKRNKDIEHILAKHNQRLEASNELANRDLLRIRKSTKAPKTSLRQLYTSGFESLHKIYPVLLTNPETVSSLLELKPNLYDLVIIDEASQMFMADALPLLYRAKTAFISGDNKQMPPSDFFMSLGDENNDDSDNGEQQENDDIVDKNRLIPADGEYCLLEAAEYSIQKGNPNQTMLLVHYRSEFKELIDFSNHAFYDGKLITATSNKKLPKFIKSPIELNKVENGQAKLSVNDLEALAVVERIKEIWQQQESLSLGVITLNVKQKDKIDDLLFEEAQINSEFANRLEQERNKTKDGEDIGFFVRSVEHVQGDERDIIILSTVYDGVRKNFGAITKKEKGRKRLNVAITRAKLGMIIYTSLNIEAISNENQRDESENYWFWKYMCYARAISENDKKTAELILQSLNQKFQQSKTEAEADSFFEIDVAEFLRSQNYHVDYQIGESGFRIDLGVKKNTNDRLYLCGIECDGRQYHSSWSARLNDIWRQKILENKGWLIIRIWSNDWFDNREVTQKKLLTDLGEIK